MKEQAIETRYKPSVKICCIGNIEEAWMAIRHGASAIGLVSEMPSGPGVISEDLIATIREFVNVPIFLAGGLTPENVVSAIHQVEPFGVDVCSGVRTDGRLDTVKLSNFFNNIATA